MNRVNKILHDEEYKIYLNRIEIYEKNRAFCRHNMEHFLDVARICYIKCLEENLNYSKDLVYATALLHDIGRWIEYEDGVCHEKASVVLSEKILKRAGFNKEEQKIILNAIASHRGEFKTKFEELFYNSDKLSRGCFLCKVEEECNWDKKKKNLDILY